MISRAMGRAARGREEGEEEEEEEERGGGGGGCSPDNPRTSQTVRLPRVLACTGRLIIATRGR